jgi:hypothetical protein
VRLSLKQALVCLDILKASVQIDGIFGGYPLKVREMVLHQIINQQSDSLVTIESEELVWDWEYLEDNGKLLGGNANDDDKSN